MEPNESSSYNENREYFQTLERQRKNVLREILYKCDNGPYKGPCKMKTTLRTPEEMNPTLLIEEDVQDGTRELQVQLAVPGQVVKRLQATETHGPIPARRNGKGQFLHQFLSKNYD
ncbi:UNVERIFIED_CONTAM: hypothetical protein Sangu_2155700 [Sesamum angustifolium]|uniref:Uncharacterized protein n=1 Tax=Sesamum angustifolium TaxID=2727405 RepID=A0AAW2LEA0_9LAMI